jgi:hypothetical protein
MLSWPFPEENALLQLVFLEKPALFYALKYAYLTMLFTTPFVAFSTALSVLYIFFAHRSKESGQIRLPKYPEIEGRDRLYLVIGEVHHAKKPEPVENPRWLVIPDRGLLTFIDYYCPYQIEGTQVTSKSGTRAELKHSKPCSSYRNFGRRIGRKEQETRRTTTMGRNTEGIRIYLYGRRLPLDRQPYHCGRSELLPKKQYPFGT